MVFNRPRPQARASHCLWDLWGLLRVPGDNKLGFLILGDINGFRGITSWAFWFWGRASDVDNVLAQRPRPQLWWYPASHVPQALRVSWGVQRCCLSSARKFPLNFRARAKACSDQHFFLVAFLLINADISQVSGSHFIIQSRVLGSRSYSVFPIVRFRYRWEAEGEYNW